MTSEAEAESDEAYEWIAKDSPQRAAKWYRGLFDKIESLRDNPERCPLAPENPVFEQEIRQLLYGKRGGVYRILFTISGETVSVLHIRHAERRFLDDE